MSKPKEQTPRAIYIPKNRPTSPGELVTDPKKRAFLDAFAKTGVVYRAAEFIGVEPSRPYRWRRIDPAFAHEFEVARRTAGKAIYDKAMELASQGVKRYVVQGGKVVKDPDTGERIVETEYPTALLIFMMKHFGMDEKGLRPLDNLEAPAAPPEAVSQADMLSIAIKSMLGANDVPALPDVPVMPDAPPDECQADVIQDDEPTDDSEAVTDDGDPADQL